MKKGIGFLLVAAFLAPLFSVAAGSKYFNQTYSKRLENEYIIPLLDSNEEYEMEQAQALIKELAKSYDEILKDEENENIAKDVKEKIKKNLDLAKRMASPDEEEWNRAAYYAIKGQIWVLLLSAERSIVNMKINYKNHTGKKAK